MIRHLVVCCILSFGSIGLQAQPPSIESSRSTNKPLPFKVLTSGKKLTVQATKPIRNLIAWTSSGNRIVEQKNLSTKQYSFVAPQKENLVFVLIEFEDGTRYTHKVGLL